jgi:hypothetical protein
MSSFNIYRYRKSRRIFLARSSIELFIARGAMLEESLEMSPKTAGPDLQQLLRVL